ncbi:histidinol-phosphate transaminase [Aliisedimentitalea scapharcae]|uniref:Histidinol-phosphate transaminase n=1 Tax=Aliisedimentitalea scapharcae TaxID=1524259 RepID=A0ABZ2XXC8_9RHOB
MINPTPHIGAMAPYALADLGPEGAVSMAQNESAFAPSPLALAAGQAALAQAALYPDPDWIDLRAAIARVHQLDAGRILCGAGSMELIGALISAFSGPGDEVLGSQFGYAYVATACQLSQSRYVTAPELDLVVSPTEILARVTPATRIVFVCNPGNPTGTTIANADLVALRRDLPDDVLLVIDQAYGEFADPLDDPACLFALVDLGNTIITRSFSKAYALAGVRVGWAYAPDRIGSEIRKVLNPNNVSIISQQMARGAIEDQAHLSDIVARTGALRDAFSTQCRALGLHVPPSQTNFALMQFGSAEDARRADQALRRHGLMMRGMGCYGLSDCLRATICDQTVMDRAVAVLKGVLT